jgi:secreted trypsin-like serine protease
VIKSRLVLSVLVGNLIILQPIVNSPSVIAIEGGEQVIGTQLVLPLMMHFGTDGFMKDASGNPLDKLLFRCSASLITSQIILTAAHCVAKIDSSDGSLYVPTSNFKLFVPGVDFNGINKTITVEKVIFAPGYANYWHPELGDTRTQKDDIAFLFISKSISSELANYKIEIANEGEVNLIKQNNSVIKHFGYGLQSKGFQDGKPHTVDLHTYPLGAGRYGNTAAENSKTISTNETGIKALCPGDSGSPWYADFGGTFKLVATLVFGSGCGNGSSSNGTLGTLVYPYIDLMEKEWAIFKASLPTEVTKPSPTPTNKKLITIKCTKGKLSKKLAGLNPKCPAGYKKV